MIGDHVNRPGKTWFRANHERDRSRRKRRRRRRRRWKAHIVDVCTLSRSILVQRDSANCFSLSVKTALVPFHRPLPPAGKWVEIRRYESYGRPQEEPSALPRALPSPVPWFRRCPRGRLAHAQFPLGRLARSLMDLSSAPWDALREKLLTRNKRIAEDLENYYVAGTRSKYNCGGSSIINRVISSTMHYCAMRCLFAIFRSIYLQYQGWLTLRKSMSRIFPGYAGFAYTFIASLRANKIRSEIISVKRIGQSSRLSQCSIDRLRNY